METIKTFEESLKLIGWSLRDMGCNHFRIRDHNKAKTQYQVTNNGLESVGEYPVAIYLGFGEDTKITTYTDDKGVVECIIFGTSNCFIQFYNHEIKAANRLK